MATLKLKKEYFTKDGKRIERFIRVGDKIVPITEESVANTAVEKVSEEEKERRKQELKQIKQERKDFLLEHQQELESGELEIDDPLVEEYKRLGEEAIEAEYEAHRTMPPIITDESKWKSGISALTREEAIVARKDMLARKDLFTAIQMAALGTSFGSDTHDTELDTLYKSDPSIYDVFKPTREQLRKKYGDTITLYRAGTGATKKATVNMASTRENAEQYAQLYGSQVTAQEIPIDDILAINISRTGGYEEFIILNR